MKAAVTRPWNSIMVSFEKNAKGLERLMRRSVLIWNGPCSENVSGMWSSTNDLIRPFTFSQACRKCMSVLSPGPGLGSVLRLWIQVVQLIWSFRGSHSARNWMKPSDCQIHIGCHQHHYYLIYIKTAILHLDLTQGLCAFHNLPDVLINHCLVNPLNPHMQEYSAMTFVNALKETQNLQHLISACLGCALDWVFDAYLHCTNPSLKGLTFIFCFS